VRYVQHEDHLVWELSTLRCGCPCVENKVSTLPVNNRCVDIAASLGSRVVARDPGGHGFDAWPLRSE